MNDHQIITNFFNSAKKGGGFEYLLTLLRVKGIESYEQNPAIAFEDLLENHEGIDSHVLLKSLVGNFVWLSIISNLDQNTKSLNYAPFPFNLNYPESCKTSREDNLFLQTICGQTRGENSPFNQRMQEVFGEEIFTTSNIDLNAVSQGYLNAHLENILTFAKAFMKVYRQILYDFRDDSSYVKMPDFTTLEFLRDDEIGLVGFKTHFSNGSYAQYRRSNTGATALNLIIDRVGVGFMVGDLGRLTQQWLVGNVPLYQVGANGRYNKFGEWKPLEFPGSSGLLEFEVKKLLGDTEDPKHNVYGCLQYMVATCHRNIEFIVKGDFDLPHQPTVYKSDFGDIYLHKIDLGEQVSNLLGNQRFYDCSLTVPEVKAETVQQAIFYIQYFVNELAFILDVKAEWFLKYPMSQNINGVLKVQEEDIDELNAFLINEKISSDDRQLVAAATSWFISGSNSNNIYTSYLCYYIAFEIIASSLVRGDMDISPEYGFEKKTKSERKRSTEACIKDLHDSKYANDPIKFIQDSYFSCIISIRENTELALKAVFGEDHQHFKSFYEKTDDVSVNSLRSKLAHGEFAFIDTDHEKAVREKLPILRNISHEFITRVSHGYKSSVKVTKPAKLRDVMFSMGDPRTVGVTNRLEMLPIKDWTIRPEWLF